MGKRGVSSPPIPGKKYNSARPALLALWPRTSVKYRSMKYSTANMATPTAKLMPSSRPTSLCVSSCQGIMAFCRGNTLAIALPGTIAHS